MKINIFKIIILLLLDNVIAIANPNNDSIVLSVTIAGTASGIVTSDIKGIECGKDCNEFYNLGTKMILTAIPNVNSVFSSWMGCVPLSNKEKCLVTMDKSKEIKAIFTNIVTSEQKQQHSELAKIRFNETENYLKKLLQEKEAAYEKSKEYWVKVKADRIAKKEAEIKAAIEYEKWKIEQAIKSEKLRLERLKIETSQQSSITIVNIDNNIPETRVEVVNVVQEVNIYDQKTSLPEPVPHPKPIPEFPHDEPESQEIKLTPPSPQLK